MKSVLEALEKRMKGDAAQIEYNLFQIKELNQEIKDLTERNEQYRVNIDEAKSAIQVLSAI